jgi:YesN/AraC family two-component response regulator
MTTPFKTPEVKFNQTKNGYEIRSDILALAKDAIMQEYAHKIHGWEISNQVENGRMITTVEMPKVPGLDLILEAAEKMYAFVNLNATKK